MIKSHGNRKRQQKKRRERIKHLPKKQEQTFELIDGNFSYYPVAYCKYHNAWMTEGLMNTHRCPQRQCRRLVMMNETN